MNGLLLNVVGGDSWGYPFHTINTLTASSTTFAYSIVMQMTEAATLTHAGFNFIQRVGTPTDLIVELRDVDASGNIGTTLHASATVASSSLTYNTSGKIQWIAFSSSYAATKGQLISVTLKTSGTWDGSNYILLGYQFNSNQEAHGNRSKFPYGLQGTGRVDGVLGGVRSSTTCYGYPATALGTSTYAFTATRYGNRFTVPSNIGGSVVLRGLVVRTLANTGSSFSLKFGSISGSTVTELFTQTVDTDVQNNSATGMRWEFVFTTPQTLTTGSEYVVGILPSGNNVQIGTVGLESSLERTAFTHSTTGDAKSGSWTSGGAWTTDDTKLYFISPVFDQINAPSGSSTLTAAPRYTINAGIN